MNNDDIDIGTYITSTKTDLELVKDLIEGFINLAYECQMGLKK
jgi:hypothetical protein